MSRHRKTSRSPVAAVTGLFVLALLAVLCACFSVLCVKVSDVTVIPWEQMLPLAIYALGIPVLLVWMRLIGWSGDSGFVGAVFLLCGVGLSVQFRMGSFAKGLTDPMALVPLPLGLIAFAFGLTLTSKGRGHWLSRLQWLAYGAAVGVLMALFLMGQRFRGGVYLAGNMTPSEIVKPLLVFFLAAYLSRRQKAFSETQAGIPIPPFKTVVGLVFLWSLPLILTVAVRDLGLMLLLNAILIIMLFAIARTTGYLAIGLASVGLAGYGIRFLSSHVQVRFDVWKNPFLDPTGKGWQMLQALSAMYSGGWWGVGLGSGVPQNVPIVTSDFVYAALAEEMGLVGCALILLTYALLFSRGFRAAGSTRTPFERLLCVGLTATLAMQTLLNVAGVTKALPLTGITLPLISHGGSSLITTLLVAGLIAGLSDRK